MPPRTAIPTAPSSAAYPKETEMTYAIIVTSALLAIVLAAAPVREHRLRKALEKLLKRIIQAWKSQNAEESPTTVDNATDTSPDSRLQRAVRRTPDRTE